jgi:diaminopropionate ammonia-lyase
MRHNPYLRLADVPALPGEPLLFHQGLREYRPTPVHALPQVAADLGLAQVLLKDESSRLGLTSFKTLGASWAIERALREWPDTKTLLAASAGNHGLAVARTAAARGIDCRIYLPAAAAPARAARIAETGARLVLVDGDYDAAVAAAEACALAGGVLIADVSADPDALTPRWVVDGYSTLFWELASQLPEPVDLVLVPAGVGSLAAAAVRWAAHQEAPPRVVAVEPDTAACVAAALTAGRPVRVPTPGTTMSGLDCGTASAAAWPTLRAGLAGAVQVTDAQVHRAMRDLAAWALAIGDCGAAPLAGLRELGLRAGGRVLLVATEGITDPDSYQAIVPSLAGTATLVATAGAVGVIAARAPHGVSPPFGVGAISGAASGVEAGRTPGAWGRVRTGGSCNRGEHGLELLAQRGELRDFLVYLG